MTIDREMLTLEQACDYLQISQSTMRRWLKNDSVPAHKAGRQWRFYKEELDEWIRRANEC